MRAGVGEWKGFFQIQLKFVYSKNDVLMKIPPLTIVGRAPVSACIAMAEGGRLLLKLPDISRSLIMTDVQ